MNKILEGKIAVVTGGCRGIGKAIVERFLRDGATVFALDYNIPAADEIFIEDIELSKSVKTVQLDVTDEEAVNKVFQDIIKEAGRIDILVNNAGITRDTLLMRMSSKDWDAVINTNLKGAFLCVKAVTRQMMSQRSGRIINMGSVVGVMGNAGQANYAASKAGLIGFTKSIAKEFGSRNILVNLIAPGYVITPMTEKLSVEQKEAFLNIIPLKRGAKPEDIANAVAFFAGPDSSYVTGQVLHVDGGMLM